MGAGYLIKQPVVQLGVAGTYHKGVLRGGVEPGCLARKLCTVGLLYDCLLSMGQHFHAYRAPCSAPCCDSSA
jgi:hypothetical protein